MKPKHQRLLFVTFSVFFITVAVLLTLRAFRENIVFFYSPSDIMEKQVEPGKTIRLGGLVEKGSVVHGASDEVSFIVTDGKSSIEVDYRGLLPNLFRDGQGVVAEGALSDTKHFAAKNILAKHDETYMPKEVVDSLKRSGHWHDR